MSRELTSYEQRLPVHGFVLAGGRSSRMGRDKALLPFRGRPMVEIAVEKLRGFCSAVSIAGNRDDLSEYAPVVYEARTDCGPAAGIEAALLACSQPWAMFVPVDVPLAPEKLLRTWARAVIQQAGNGFVASYLQVNGKDQPAFCMLRAELSDFISDAVSAGERRVRNLLWGVEQAAQQGGLWVCDVEQIAEDLLDKSAPLLQVDNWFKNINTPDEHLFAEAGFGPE